MADRLRVTELDFDTIKSNLRAFLNQQTQFSDYDFEGSGLSVLLDVLAYNTHYNAYYLNMVANESFMDTALLRDSVVSHAKSLGYVPHSMKAPVAIINFEVVSGSNTPSTLTIPAGYSFLSNQIDSKVYNFVVLSDTTVSKANNSFYFENLELYEGQLINYAFPYNKSSNPKQIFTLPDTNIDTTTIKVAVAPSAVSTSVSVYTLVTNVVDITFTSEAFYLQESKGGQYQIYFGDDFIGKSIPDGGIVSVSYLLTNGVSANKANNFVGALTLSDSLAETLTNFTVTPISSAAGGAERETVDDIKFSAVAQYSTQNRLITTKDYESYIRKNYPSVGSLSVWGGEEESPPVYGKVFLSLKPKTNYYISETEKQRIIDEIIKPKSIVAVETIILDPEYLYLLLENKVQYNTSKTTQTSESLKNSIKNAILLYNTTNLSKFDSTLVLSKLQDAIDSVDLNAIVGSECTLKLQKRFEPNLGVASTYQINFHSELYRGTVTNKLTSTEFTGYDNDGILRNVQIEEVPDSYTGVSSVEVVSGGSGYTTAPIVTITGDGYGATAVAVVVNGKIESINVTNRGQEYSRALITITGGNGYGASAIPVLDTKFGTLRTIFYNTSAERQIINPAIGTINYSTGLVTLNDLRVMTVLTTDGLIRLTIESEKGIIRSTKNTIITIDSDDSSAIATELTAI
jgi:hypothetical protein